MRNAGARRRNKDAKQGFAMIGAAIVLGAGVLTFAAWSEVPSDEDNCPLQPKERLSLVVDRTDAVSSIGAARIKAELESIISGLPDGSEANLWLQDGNLVSRPAKRICTMPIGRFSTDKYRRDERDRFKHDVAEVLDGLSLAKTSEKTMLIETVVAATLYEKGKPADRNRLVVVSDGLENSDYLSYRENGKDAPDLWIGRGGPIPELKGWEARFIEVKRLASPPALRLQESGSAALLRGLLVRGGAARVDVTVVPDRIAVPAAGAISNQRSAQTPKGKPGSRVRRSARRPVANGGSKA